MWSEAEHKKVRGKILGSSIKAIKYVDDCQVPYREVTIKYSGSNIKKVMGEIPDVMTKALQVSGTKIYHDEYYWDDTNPNNIVFHSKWTGEKGMDMHSTIFAEIYLKNGRLKPDGSGSFDLEFSAILETTFDKDTLLRRSSFYDLIMKAYTYLWYDNIRRQFLFNCNDYLGVMMRELRGVMGLMKRGEDYGK